MLSPAHIASSQIRSKRWIPTTRPLNFVEPSLGHKTRPTHTFLRQLRQLLKDDIICFKTYQEWSRISILRSGLGPTSFWIFWDFGDFGSSRPQDNTEFTFELQIPFAFVSWVYWVYHNLMSSHLNLDSFRSKHVKILFIYCFCFFAVIWSLVVSALRRRLHFESLTSLFPLSLPHIQACLQSWTDHHIHHNSDLCCSRKELPTRIFVWNGWNLGLAQGSVCVCAQYFDLQDIQVEVIQKWSPILINVMCFHTCQD